MLLNVPLPIARLVPADTDGEERQLLACFPLVGAAIGIVMYTIAWLAMFFFPVPAAAAVVGAIIIALITESVSTGGNISTLTALVRARQNKSSVEEILLAVEKGYSQQNATDLMFFISFYLLKMFCIGLLIYFERASWLIIVFTMSYLIRSQMATWNDLRTSQPLIEEDNEIAAVRAPWTLGLIILFIIGLSYLPIIPISILVAYLLIKYFKKFTDREFGGVSGSIVGTAGAAAELVFLLLGIAFLIRQ